MENCAVEPLSSILFPETIMKLANKTAQKIAAENNDVQSEMSCTLFKLGKLEVGLLILSHMRRFRLGDM